MAQPPLQIDPRASKAELDLPGVDMFSKLPTEITLNIFTYLTHNDLFHSALVCREWYYTTSDATLWHNLDLSPLRQPSLVNYAPPAALSIRLSSAHSLTLSSPTRISTTSILSLLLHSSTSLNLTSLTLTNISNLRTTSPQLCNFFATTRSKHLSHVNLSSTAVTTPVIAALLKSHRTTLRTLTLDFTEIGDGALRAIATAERLEKLSLSACFGLSKPALRNFLARRIPGTVKVLGLRWLLDVRVTWLFELLSRNCVEEVDVSGCERLTLAEVRGVEKRWGCVKVVHTAVLVEDSIWGYRKYVEYLTTLPGEGVQGVVPVRVTGEAC